MSPNPPSKDAPRFKILIRATNWIGDAVMSLPAMRALRGCYPDAEISVLARPWVAALYEGETSIDYIITLPGEPGARDWRSKAQAIVTLREERFDLAVLLPNSFESAAVVWLGGAKRIVGYNRDGRGFFLTDKIAAPVAGEIPKHERFYYLELLHRGGFIDSLPDVPEIRFSGIEKTRHSGGEMLKLFGVTKPVIGVSPGAAFGGAKRWLPERFAEAASRLAVERGAVVLVFGSAAEKALCEEVARLAGGRSMAGATSLRAFVELTSVCTIFLTNDSGAMHIASALGVPTVTVFGPTDEAATGPLGDSAVCIRQPVDCAPCLKRECPIDHRCMTRVSVDEVLSAANQLILPGHK